FLRWVQIKGADRIEYGLGESLGQFRYFFAHNVETPQQAAALHACFFVYKLSLRFPTCLKSSFSDLS
ncbi:hypothetical protein KKA69_01095, partial [Patescibacteria group bacterium]|nr:hypothetical protein [Patescibacteria group bacterium]